MKDPSNALNKLLEVIETLRGPDGCPWDQEQTLEDVGRHLLEEASEVVDAIEDAQGRPAPEVCEELGDVLMNVMMASVIGAETDSFELGSIAEGVREKLIRRHPHVFSGKKAENSEEVLKLWNAIKAKEKEDRGEPPPASRFSDVPRSLPPVLRAEKISRKASAFGFDWEEPAGVIEKLREEIGELEEALGAGAEKDGEIIDELGDILFTSVNVCRKLGVSADAALRQATAKFTRRVNEMEKLLGNLDAAGSDEMNQAWDKVKGEDLR